MTFATHCSACEGLAGLTRALYLRARASCKRCYKKAGSKQHNQARKTWSSIGSPKRAWRLRRCPFQSHREGGRTRRGNDQFSRDTKARD